MKMMMMLVVFLMLEACLAGCCSSLDGPYCLSVNNEQKPLYSIRPNVSKKRKNQPTTLSMEMLLQKFLLGESGEKSIQIIDLTSSRRKTSEDLRKLFQKTFTTKQTQAILDSASKEVEKILNHLGVDETVYKKALKEFQKQIEKGEKVKEVVSSGENETEAFLPTKIIRSSATTEGMDDKDEKVMKGDAGENDMEDGDADFQQLLKQNDELKKGEMEAKIKQIYQYFERKKKMVKKLNKEKNTEMMVKLGKQLQQQIEQVVAKLEKYKKVKKEKNLPT